MNTDDPEEHYTLMGLIGSGCAPHNFLFYFVLFLFDIFSGLLVF
jgi:hypothetical protein